MYLLYRVLTSVSAPLLSYILNRRCKNNKEIPYRVCEKKGIIEKKRPDGRLIWIHAASIGEAQSALILIQSLNAHRLNNDALSFLVTTGTVTSAQIMENTLPQNAFHQFYPLDHPQWVQKFLNHWKPNCVIWMESELWPNMLYAIKNMDIPAILVNAHISDKSYTRWLRMRSLAATVLSTFQKILCQTERDKKRFDDLGALQTVVTDNLKYSATPLSFNPADHDIMIKAIQNRPLWLYASTHKGEERIACDIHKELKKSFPKLLTIIVPRHPERRTEIKDICTQSGLQFTFRGDIKTLPRIDDDIYIADTLGELGLFYRVCPVACIGRSFSDDGGGGHNPIEAAQLGCAILYGPHVQNLQDIFDEMRQANAAIQQQEPTELQNTLRVLLTEPIKLVALQNAGLLYSQQKDYIIKHIMDEICTVISLNTKETAPNAYKNT